MNTYQLNQMCKVYQFPKSDFTQWPESSQRIFAEEYFNSLSAVEREEIQSDASVICAHINIYTQSDVYIKAMRATISSLLHERAAEVLRCSGLTCY